MLLSLKFDHIYHVCMRKKLTIDLQAGSLGISTPNRPNPSIDELALISSKNVNSVES